MPFEAFSEEERAMYYVYLLESESDRTRRYIGLGPVAGLVGIEVA